MANILTIAIMAMIALVGGLPTIAITVSIPIVLGWKIYRKVKLGYSIYQ